ncbi:MAG: hypothetical protein U0Q21_08820 [Dermatophilaceae bacterium]
MTTVRDPFDILRAARPTDADLAREFDPNAGGRVLAEVLERAGRPHDIRTTHPTPRRGRRWVGLVLAAAGAATALAIGPSLIDPSGGPSASALSALAQTAATQKDGPIPVGEYVHLTVTQVQHGDAGAIATVGSSSTPAADETRIRDLWVGADGTTYAKLSGPDMNTVIRFPATAPYDPATVATLPIDSDGLYRWFATHTSGSSSAHEAVFVGVGDLLRTGFAPPLVARAAIESLDHLPEVTTAPATTPAGAHGVRVTFRDNTIREGYQYLVFDSATADVVEEGSDDERGHSYRSVTAYDGLVETVPRAILDAAIDPETEPKPSNAPTP